MCTVQQCFVTYTRGAVIGIVKRACWHNYRLTDTLIPVKIQGRMCNRVPLPFYFKLISTSLTIIFCTSLGHQKALPHAKIAIFSGQMGSNHLNIHIQFAVMLLSKQTKKNNHKPLKQLKTNRSNFIFDGLHVLNQLKYLRSIVKHKQDA